MWPGCFLAHHSANLHLANGDLIQPLEPLALRQFHGDELRVHALDVAKKVFLGISWRFLYTRRRVALARQAPLRLKLPPSQGYGAASRRGTGQGLGNIP